MRSLRVIKVTVILATAAAIAMSALEAGRVVAAEEEAFAGFTGKLVKVIGDVKVRRAGEKGWIEAKQGMDVAARDEIMTGSRASADIMFKRSGKRSNVRILEDANMSLMTLNLDKVSGESEILLDLAIGHIIIMTDPLEGESKFEVLTPTSMTAVRGTGFEVIVTRGGQGAVADGGGVR